MGSSSQTNAVVDGLFWGAFQKWSGLGYENGTWGYHEFSAMQVANLKK